MTYLAAAVAVVGVLCLLDLLLTVGVVRRLREHSLLLSQAPARAGTGQPPPRLAPGEPVPEFSTTTTAGDPISRDLFAGETLVGFFSPGCAPCQALLPAFVEHAKGARRVLAVIAGGESAEYAKLLTPVASVVVEGYEGAVSSAFGVAMFPALFVVSEDGTVIASGGDLEALSQAAPATGTR